MYFVLRMRSKGGPQYPRKEIITAFSGSSQEIYSVSKLFWVQRKAILKLEDLVKV